MQSGTSEVEQGISKAGNKRVRWLMVELAWSWLRFQPDSQLSHWFNQRFGGAGKRLRRIGIVALAQRLAIALWRYLQHGEIPAGAILKSRVINMTSIWHLITTEARRHVKVNAPGKNSGCLCR